MLAVNSAEEYRSSRCSICTPARTAEIQSMVPSDKSVLDLKLMQMAAVVAVETVGH